MDDNQLSDSAYEERAKIILRDVGIALGVFAIIGVAICLWVLR